MQSELDGSNRRRCIDLVVNQRVGSLYHIDWGDGTEEVSEAPLEVESASDRMAHRYASSGEYTITLSTTDATEVTGLNLQITGNGTGDKIQSLEIEDLPNLTVLSMGDKTLITIAPFLQRFTNLNQLGFRFGNLAYCNDVNGLPKRTLEHLQGLDVLVLDALRYTPHPSHANLDQALEWISELKPRRAVLTNLHVDLDYQTLVDTLPKGVEPGFDGWAYEAML